MTDQSAPTREDRVQKLQGLGSSRKRVEDARFTQGKGNYIDDMKLPGMLFGDFVRSPYGHARITSIDAFVRLTREMSGTPAINR
jgi:carbon-monoxide dehydrogenase large subunit